jgi:SWI/SNF chromatin-remodeling complex subunit SWI1
MVPPHVAAMVAAVNGPLAAALDPQRGKPQFLSILSDLHARKGIPLPPDLTGILNDAYDPTTSHWRILELTNEPGVIRVGSNELDLFKLWQVLLSLGLSNKVRSCSHTPDFRSRVEGVDGFRV